MSQPSGRESRVFLPALLGTTAALKVALAWAYPGFHSGDDLEIVQTAARYAVGLNYTPWAIRSLFHPLLLAYPVMKAGVAAGLSSPRWLTLLAALPTAAFSTLSVWLADRVARALEASEAAALVAAFLTATAWVPFAYGATPYPRPISSALLLAAFLLVVRNPRVARDAALAGIFVAAAFAVRWSEGIALIPLTIVALGRDRRGLRAAALIAGFVAGALLFVGVLDALTWGAPFASLKAFVAFLPQAREVFKSRPVWWYAGMILQWAGPVLLVLAAAAARDRRAREPLLVAVSMAALLSLTSLKNLRYMMAAIVFLAVAASFGWERLRRGGRAARWLAAGCLIAAVPLCAERTVHLLGTKSQAAIAAAQFLARRQPPVRAVALEQSWAYGDRLYLGNEMRIVDVTPSERLDPDVLIRAGAECDALGIYTRDLNRGGRETLLREGWALEGHFESAPGNAVDVFARR